MQRCLSNSVWPRAISTLWTFLGVTQVHITSSLTGTSLQTVSMALLGVTGTTLGDLSFKSYNLPNT